MDVHEWFNNGCDYNQGVMIYRGLKGHKPNLLRLFLKSDSIRNQEKLQYELKKLAPKPVKSKSAVPNRKQSSTPAPISTFPTTPTSLTVNTTHKNYFYRLNQLDPQLHPMSMKQRSNFQLAIHLKLKLNDLKPEEEIVALSISLEIEDLFDRIEHYQKILDYYVDHKIVLNVVVKDYSELSPAALLQTRNNKRASVSKYETKIKSLTKELSGKLTKSERTKKSVSLSRAEAKKIEHEVQLLELNSLIR